MWQTLANLDKAIFGFIHSFAAGSGLFGWLAIILASYLPWALGAAAILFILTQRPWQARVWLLIAGALTLILSRGIIAEAIYFLWSRQRPFSALAFDPLISHAAGNAFPSGHATAFFAIAFVIWFYRRSAGAWFLALTTLMSVARIYVGVHWPLDVIGGFVIALASAAIVHACIKRFAPEPVKKTVPEAHEPELESALKPSLE